MATATRHHPAKLAALLLASWLLCLLAGSHTAWAGPTDDLKAGYASFRLGDKKGAIRYLDKAIASRRLGSRDMIIALSTRGDCYVKLRDYTKASSDYQRALDIARRGRDSIRIASLHTKLGQIFHKQSKYQKALSQFSQAIKINPRLAMAYYHRSVTYFRLKKNQASLKDLNWAIRLEPRHYFYHKRGFVYERLGKLNLALADAQKALEMRPGRRRYQSRVLWLKKKLPR